ncbi:MAG: TIM barrel protein [Planctomycetes bacterium]|nr:TIM barrel protein [Planctomycetota bacterium]
MLMTTRPTRRRFCQSVLASVAALGLPRGSFADTSAFKLRYILASAMYGTTALADILPEVHKAGATALDIWPKPHGNQREQVDELGVDAFETLLQKNHVPLGCITCYAYGPFGLQPQMQLAQQVGSRQTVFVTGASGPKGQTGDALDKAVAQFVEKMKPHHDAAAKFDYTIAIENHVNSLIESPESMRRLAEHTTDMPHLGIAFGPHHLEQDAAMQAKLIEDLGPCVKFFYAQQHGKGASKPQPVEDEHMQMPGNGPLDFKPLVQSLKKINFAGYTEIFMHPFPRGVPIRPTTDAITAEINTSRQYLDHCMKD